MKKFLIGVIFLIPILVVMALSAAGTIIANNKQVFPTSIVIKDSNNKEITDKIEIDTKDTNEFIIIEVLPTISYSKEIGYYFDEVQGYNGKIELKQIDRTNKYQIIPKVEGTARVIVYSKVEANVSRAFTVHIASRAVGEIVIYDDKGTPISSLSPLSQTQLYYDIFPMDAVQNRQIEWVSDDENIVKINQNGMIYPVSRGRTSVHLYATDKDNIRHDKFIEVDTRSALAKRTEVYATTPIDSEYIKENIAIGKNATVNAIGGNKFALSENGVTVEITTNVIADEGYDFFNLPEAIYTNNGITKLECHYLINYMERLNGVQYTNENPTVGAIVGDEFVPKKAGKTVIYASYNGERISKSVIVKERPYSFDLALNSEDNKRGIQRNRVWGYNWLDGDKYVHTYQFGANIGQTDDMANYDIVWSVNDPTYASIDQNALITFYEASLGHTVVVSATIVVNGRLTNTVRQYSFNMLKEANCLNVYTWEQLKGCVDRRSDNLVFQNDIDMLSDARVYRSVYGNGFTASAVKRNRDGRVHAPIFDTVDFTANDRLQDEMRFENLTIVGTNTFEESENSYRAIYCRQSKGINFVFKNLQIKNCGRGLDLSAADNILVEGNILGDNFGVSLLLNFDPDDSDNVVTLRNNVFKYSKGPSVSVGLKVFDAKRFGKAYNPTIIIDGFLDSYNWKTPEEFGDIFDAFGLTDFGGVGEIIDPKVLVDAIKGVLNQIASNTFFMDLTYKHTDNKNYFSMGIFALGAMCKVDPDRFIINDKRLRLVECELKKADGLIGAILRTVNEITSKKGMPILNSCYFLGYDYTNSPPAYKPHDPIPQTLELYDKLNGI